MLRTLILAAALTVLPAVAYAAHPGPHGGPVGHAAAPHGGPRGGNFHRGGGGIILLPSAPLYNYVPNCLVIDPYTGQSVYNYGAPGC
jgi:hypothetical protein